VNVQQKNSGYTGYACKKEKRICTSLKHHREKEEEGGKEGKGKEAITSE